MSYKRKEISFFPVYKEMGESMLLISDEQIGKIMKIAINYAFSGKDETEAESNDLVIKVLCKSLFNDIDRHKESYEEKCEINKYNRYKRSAYEKDEDPLSFEEWKSRQNEENAGGADESEIPGTTVNLRESFEERQRDVLRRLSGNY